MTLRVKIEQLRSCYQGDFGLVAKTTMADGRLYWNVGGFLVLFW